MVLFEFTLAIGNYINGGTSRGGASGFQLDTIEKCYDIKGKDNKHNLLMYILEQTEDKTKKNILNGMDITELEVISKVPLNQIQSEIAEMKQGYMYVQKAIESQTEKPEDQIKLKLQEYEMDIKMKISDAEIQLKVLFIVKIIQLASDNEI